MNTETRDVQGEPAVAAFRDGGFIVVLDLKQTGRTMARAFTPRCSMVRAEPRDVEFRVNTTTAKDQSQPVITALTPGNFVATWTSADQDGSGDGVFGQRFKVIPPTTNQLAKP